MYFSNRIKQSIIVGAIIFSQQTPVLASPTINEFEECNLRATKHLEYCLKDNINTISDACWQKSKSAYETCRTGVISRHDTSKQKEMAELSKALEEMNLDE